MLLDDRMRRRSRIMLDAIVLAFVICGFPSLGVAANGERPQEPESARTTEGGEVRELLECALCLADRHNKTSYKIESRAEIARKLAEIGAREKAVQVISDVHEKAKTVFSWEDEEWFVIAETYARLGRGDDALAVISKALKATQLPRTWQRSRIASALFEAGHSEKALSVLQKAREAMRDMERAAASPVFIARAYARGGHYKPALEITTGIQEARFKGDALAVIVQEWGKAAQQEPDDDILFKALEAARDVEDSEYRGLALFSIAKAFAETGQLDKAVGLCDRIASNQYRVKALMSVAGVLIERGQRDRGVTLLEEPFRTLQDSWGIEAGPYLAGVYARAGRYAKALDVARNPIYGAYLTSWALAWIARVRAEQGAMHKAREILTEAEEAALKTQGLSPTTALRKVASIWSRSVLKNKDTRIVDEALRITARVAEKEKGGWYRSLRMLNKLAGIFGRADIGPSEEGRAILQDICNAK